MKKYFYPAVEAFRGGDNLIRIVGHRGARGLVPENTMVGFRSAISMGIQLISCVLSRAQLVAWRVG